MLRLWTLFCAALVCALILVGCSRNAEVAEPRTGLVLSGEAATATPPAKSALPAVGVEALPVVTADAPPTATPEQADQPPLAATPQPTPPTVTQRPAETATPAAAAAVTTSTGRSDPSQESPTGEVDRASFTQALADLVSAARVARGIPALGTNAALSAAAQRFAQTMAEGGWSPANGHNGPDGSTTVQRVEQAGYLGWTKLAETLAWAGRGAKPQSLVDGLLNSAPHRQRLLDPELREYGVGCYFTSRSQVGWVFCAIDLGSR